MPPKTCVVVSRFGRITLPAALRKRLGIKAGSLLALQEREGEIGLRLVVTSKIERYSDAQIAEWDRQDRLDATTRKRLMHRLKRKRRRGSS